MLTITIEYKPIPPRRRGTTHAIATALRTLQSTPNDADGNPPSFTVPKKYQSAVRIAAKDVGVNVATYTEGDEIRVRLADGPADNTMPLPLDPETQPALNAQ
jgi:hypothetical protein